MRELCSLFGTGTLELGTHYHCTPTNHTRDTVRRDDLFITISPSKTHVLPDSCDFRLCIGGHSLRGTEVRITHCICIYPNYWSVWKGLQKLFSILFLVSRSKEGLKKERRPITNRQLLYQLSLLHHFLPHGATVTIWFQVFQSNTNNFHTFIWFQVFSSNSNS